MLTKAILVAAKAKITDAANWTTDTFFRHPDGTEAHDYGPSVTCMCAAGALAAAIDDNRPDPSPKLAVVSIEFQHAWIEMNSLADRYSEGVWSTVQAVNDEGGHEAVLKFYDYAIAHTPTEA